MRSLNYDEMRVLASLFEQWVFEEANFSPDQRTFLIQLSADYEAISDTCGADWRATDFSVDDPLVFIARQDLLYRKRRAAWSRYLDRRPSYK